MSHFKQNILISTLGLALATPAIAGSERLIYDPDNRYFLSDIDQGKADPNANFVLRGSVGGASIVGQEHVYAGTTGTNNLSLLVWETTAPIGSLDLKVRLPDAWTLRGHFDAALPVKSRMTDYDWIPPYNTGYGMNDWSDRSISPNTPLDWYFSGDIAFGRDLPVSDALTVNTNVGFKYTDVQWTAIGGDFIYSDGGYHNDVGSLPDSPAARYRQQLPVLFAGIDASVDDGPWSLEAGGRAGLILGGQARDDHYMRVPPRYTIDEMTWGQMLSADAKLGYDFSDHLGVFLEGSYEKTFAGHTPKQYRRIDNNAQLLPTLNIGGGELDVATIKAGLKGNF